MARKKSSAHGSKAQNGGDGKASSPTASQLTGWFAQLMAVMDRIGAENLVLDGVTLDPEDRDLLLRVPHLSKGLKTKLAKETPLFAMTDLFGIIPALVQDIQEGEPAAHERQIAFLLKLCDQLTEKMDRQRESNKQAAKRPRPKAAADTVFQFKITLKGSKPPIWRRIQVTDCTLDDLHGHIQTAMGWTNSHLYAFEIKGEQYSDPAMLEDCLDSTRTYLSQIVPATAKTFRFLYEYDFGDGWMHEVVFEGRSQPKPGQRYPLCVTGKRACPPEDIGGIWGYAEFLAALADPQHERHDEFLEWGGPFDPEEFDAAETTELMQ
jgi:hypothetical protein